MADNRRINSNVRLDGKEYGKDQEDELSSLLTPEEGERLLNLGALEGDWEFRKQSVKPAKPKPVAQTPLSPLPVVPPAA